LIEEIAAATIDDLAQMTGAGCLFQGPEQGGGAPVQGTPLTGGRQGSRGARKRRRLTGISIPRPPDALGLQGLEAQFAQHIQLLIAGADATDHPAAGVHIGAEEGLLQQGFQKLTPAKPMAGAELFE
jgi:hypothetical protein